MVSWSGLRDQSLLSGTDERTMTVALENMKVGDGPQDHVSPEITRHVLALFCGASGDHNPIHVDIDFAKRYGMPDVFAHGMLSMAYLAQLLTRWVPQSQIKSWSTRFLAITPVHARLKCTGRVSAIFEEGRHKYARLNINAHTDGGVHVLSGEAVILLA
jgi:acyl dehydratase